MTNNDAATVKFVRGKQWCWVCGRSAGNPPANWYAPFGMETMHIASGQGDALRGDDRRLVICGCSRCHSLHVSDSDRLPTKNISGEDYPTIDAKHALWVKQKLDREHYDRKFLAEFWIGTVPIPEKPPSFFLEELAKNQGLVIS